MRREYDFSKSRKNPYVTCERRPVTIRIATEVIEYFKAMAVELDIPYQRLINLFLQECAREKKKLRLKWQA